MSAHVEVVSTDLRRTKVKVTPGTYLVDVLDEACKKFNLNSDKYQLKHKQKLIDLSGPFRTSGLVSGAKLELVQKSKSAAVVSIALDVNGQRYTKKLSSDMTLWQVMRQFEVAEKGLNLTGRGTPKSSTGPQGTSGQLYFEAPVVNIMGREYTSMEDLQKTLSQCGINSGSMVLRVSFRDTDKTLYEAMQDIGQYLKDVEPDQPKPQNGEPSAPATGSAPAIKEPIEDLTLAAGPKPVKESTLAEPELQVGSADVANAAAPVALHPEPVPKTGPMDIVDEVVTAPLVPPTETKATPSDPTEHSDPLAPTGVFNAPSSTTPLAAQIEVDESVYEPTIAHAQLRQQQLLQRAQNQRLKSDAELAADAAQEAVRLAKITQVDIKIRFPDQTSAQWTVTPEHTGAFLHQAVKGVMAHPDQPFRLILPGTHPTVAVQDGNKKLVAGYKLRGRALLNLLWEDAASEEARKSPFLKGSVASRAQEVVVPDVSREEAEEEEVQAGPSLSGGQEVKRKGDHGLDSDAVMKKLGKLFKLPGRK